MIYMKDTTKTKKMTARWSAEDRRAFAEQRLRAKKQPNKKRVASREACRRGNWS